MNACLDCEHVWMSTVYLVSRRCPACRSRRTTLQALTPVGVFGLALGLLLLPFRLIIGLLDFALNLADALSVDDELPGCGCGPLISMASMVFWMAVCGCCCCGTLLPTDSVPPEPSAPSAPAPAHPS